MAKIITFRITDENENKLNECKTILHEYSKTIIEKEYNNSETINAAICCYYECLKSKTETKKNG